MDAVCASPDRPPVARRPMQVIYFAAEESVESAIMAAPFVTSRLAHRKSRTAEGSSEIVFTILPSMEKNTI